MGATIVKQKMCLLVNFIHKLVLRFITVLLRHLPSWLQPILKTEISSIIITAEGRICGSVKNIRAGTLCKGIPPCWF